MKIPNANQIREADAFTIANEPISSIDLMERASNRFVESFRTIFPDAARVHVLCGQGNNGGDGMAVVRLLKDRGVEAWAYCPPLPSFSADAQVNHERLDSEQILSWADFLERSFSVDEVVIDALFGSGLNRPLEGEALRLITAANKLVIRRVALDIPSGLGADKYFGKDVFRAHHTITFQWPKRSFFFDETLELVGQVHCVDIGLSLEFEQGLKASTFWFTEDLARTVFRPRRLSAHKYNYGKGWLFAGHQGMMGAAILSSRAAVRSGLGLLKIHVPHGAGNLMHELVPEALVDLDISHDCITHIPSTDDFNAVGFGPGLGRDHRSEKVLLELIQRCKENSKPIVVDADGIFHLANILRVDPSLDLGSMIVTPHLGELSNLIGRKLERGEAREEARRWSSEHRAILLLKGACTEVYHPNGEVFVLNEGVPGMATAGSGDVLTGCITAFLSQGYPPLNAALLAAYVHGRAGCLAGLKKSQTGLIASDIIDYLSDVFIKLENQ